MHVVAESRAAKASNGWLTPVVGVFLLAMVLANISGAMFDPYLALYLKELHAGVDEIGFYFTAAMLLPIVFQIFGGWLSDRLGRLNTIALGSLAGAFSWVGNILAPTWGWLLGAEMLGSVTRSLVAPSFDAFIADCAPEKDRGRIFGVTQTIYMVVGLVGPLLGGFMVDSLGFKSLILVGAGFYFSATAIRVIMARCVRAPPVHAGEMSLKDFGRSVKGLLAMMTAGGVVLWLVLADGLRDVASGLSTNLESLYLRDVGGLSASTMGVLHAITTLAMMVTMVPAGILSDQRGERSSLSLGFVLMALSLGTMVTARSFANFAVAHALMGVAMGMVSPAFQSLLSKVVPPRLRGVAMGFFSTSNSLLALPAPWLGSLLWVNISPRAPFLVAAVMMLAVAPVVWLKVGSRTADVLPQPESLPVPLGASSEMGVP